VLTKPPPTGIMPAGFTKGIRLKSTMRSPGFLLTLIVLTVIVVPPAHAYIDPGTGSMIIQVLIAVVVGGAFAVKMSWKKLSAFLRRLFRKDDPSR
jgi:hypothetical protein